MPDFTVITQSAVAVVIGLLAIYGAFHVAIKALGAAIPGRDKVEIFGELLDEKVAPIVKQIQSATDLLNPKTNGGAGNPPPDSQ